MLGKRPSGLALTSGREALGRPITPPDPCYGSRSLPASSRLVRPLLDVALPRSVLACPPRRRDRGPRYGLGGSGRRWPGNATCRAGEIVMVGHGGAAPTLQPVSHRAAVPAGRPALRRESPRRPSNRASCEPISRIRWRRSLHRRGHLGAGGRRPHATRHAAPPAGPLPSSSLPRTQRFEQRPLADPRPNASAYLNCAPRVFREVFSARSSRRSIAIAWMLEPLSIVRRRR